MRSLVITACIAGLVALAGCGRHSTVEGEGSQKLTVTGPPPITISQGDIAEFKVRVIRRGVEGAVVVTFAHMPAGVVVTDSGMGIPGDEGTFHLQAMPRAALVSNHQALMTATAPDGIAASVNMTITVIPK